MMGERREERRRVRVGRAVSTAVVAVVAAVAVLAGCAVGKPRLIVDDAVVNANRKMEMDAEDFLERQHRSGHMYAANALSSFVLSFCFFCYFCSCCTSLHVVACGAWQLGSCRAVRCDHSLAVLFGGLY